MALGATYATLPTFIGLAVAGAHHNMRGPFSTGGRWICAMLILAVGFGAGTVGAAKWFESARERELDAEILWIDGLRAKLEFHRATHGSYPPDLTAVQLDANPPLLVRTGDLSYRTRSAGYEIAINTSRGLAFHGARFENEAGVWVR